MSPSARESTAAEYLDGLKALANGLAAQVPLTPAPRVIAKEGPEDSQGGSLATDDPHTNHPKPTTESDSDCVSDPREWSRCGVGTPFGTEGRIRSAGTGATVAGACHNPVRSPGPRRPPAAWSP
jgi:hypothetical protein